MSKNSHLLLTLAAFVVPLSLGVILLWSVPALAKNTPSPDSIRNWINFALATTIGVLGLLGSIFGGIAWYNGAIEKRFAAQRSFEHLRKNQEQMGQALALIDTQLDEISNDIKQLLKTGTETEHQLDLLKMQATEAKGLVTATFQQIQILASKMDGNTGGWARSEMRQ